MLDKRSTSETAKILFIGSLSILALFLGFFTDYWGVADKQWFGNHQRDMENHVIGRMVRSRQDGIFSDGGLMGIGSPDTTLKYFPARPFQTRLQLMSTASHSEPSEHTTPSSGVRECFSAFLTS